MEILALLLEFRFYLFLAKDRRNVNAHIIGPTQLQHKNISFQWYHVSSSLSV